MNNYAPLTQDEIDASSIDSANTHEAGWEIVYPVPADTPPAPTFHPQYGKSVSVWDYPDPQGELIFKVRRFEPTGMDKKVIPQTLWRNDQGSLKWKWKAIPDSRPLYNLPIISQNPETDVIVVEGEKCAEAAMSIFRSSIVTTSSGGSCAASKTDWSPIAGRQVLIWPDADGPGLKYANDVAENLVAYGCNVRIIDAMALAAMDPNGGGREPVEAWDVADAINEWESPALGKAAFDYAKPFKADHIDSASLSNAAQDSPIPLHRGMRPAEEFPVDELVYPLGEAVKATVDIVKCPTPLAVGSVLAAASLAVMPHANVIHPVTGRKVPLSLYLLEIGESGERKSEADALAQGPVRRRESELREDFDGASARFNIEHRAWELAKKKCEDNAKGNRDATVKALTELGPEPMGPLSPELTVGEPTFEGLQNCFATGHPALGLFSDEGGSFIGGHAMSNEAKLRSIAGLSRLWDGKALDRTRAKEKLIMPGRRLAVHLMAQPEVASLMISDPMLKNQGYLGRFLICYPASMKGRRFYTERKPETDEALRRYGDKLLRIFQIPMPIKEGTKNVLDPRDIKLSPEGVVLWREYTDHVEAQLAEGAELRRISEFASKLGEHGLRLAAIFALVEDIQAAEITVDHLSRAIKVAGFYTNEMLRIHDAGYISPEIQRAEALLHWLQNKRDEEFISLPVIYQNGPTPFRVKKTAQAAVDLLVEHNWLHPVSGRVQVAGKFSRQAWRIVREN